MATDLLELMSSTLGPQLVTRAGSFLGASESSMQGAVNAALPTLLGGVMQKASTPSGAAELMKLLQSPQLDPAISGNLGSYLGGGEKTSSLLAQGSELLTSLFGDKLGTLLNALASAFGLKSAAASNLMALAAPMVLGNLKNYVTQNRLDAKGLASLLAGQADYLKPRLDSRITSALGFATPMAFLSSLSGAAGRAAGAVGSAAGRAADTVGRRGRTRVHLGRTRRGRRRRVRIGSGFGRRRCRSRDAPDLHALAALGRPRRDRADRAAAAAALRRDGGEAGGRHRRRRREGDRPGGAGHGQGDQELHPAERREDRRDRRWLRRLSWWRSSPAPRPPPARASASTSCTSTPGRRRSGPSRRSSSQ